MRPTRGTVSRRIRVAALALSVLLPGCGLLSNTWLASSGPIRRNIKSDQHGRIQSIRLIDVDFAVTQRLKASQAAGLFSEVLQPTDPAESSSSKIGPGDVLGITVWEAPPAALFSSAALTAPISTGNGTVTALAMNFPSQIVEADGSIKIPFAGAVAAGGKSPVELDAEIERRLKSSANQPQVLVQILQHNSANVTVVGAVTQSVRMPLTPKGERLLDAVAAAGGVNQPTSKVMLQLTRGSQVYALPMDTVIERPSENVILAPSDVVSALFQPSYFTVLGATNTNAEVPFEAQGISLVQAIARAGGVIDTRADARGVFLFRFENPGALTPEERAGPTMPDGRIPVIYRFNMKDPATFLVAEQFPMHHRDVLYVANAPAAELQKFLTILTSSIYSVYTLINLGQ
jgi:polysaccharide export outer membrane protein